MANSRKDNKGRVLRRGESYRAHDKRYQFTYVDEIGERRYIYSKDILKLREREKEIQRNELDGISRYIGGHITVNEAVDRYFSIKTNLRRTTKHNYTYMYDKFVRDTFGKRMLDSVRYSDVKAFYIKLVEQNDMQPNTAATIHCVLKPTFEMAVRDQVIRANPTTGVMAEINKSYGKNKGVRHALTVDQQQAFMNFIQGHPVFDHWHRVFTVLLGTGCRCGEFIGLRWDDVDMDKRTINIDHALVRVPKNKRDRKRRLGVSLPKTEAGIRVIPMMDQVYEALQAEYEFQSDVGFCEAEIEGMTGFIFYNANGNPLCEQNINSAIRRITESYNAQEEVSAAREKRDPVLLPHFSCHHLRHTFCTRYCENETNLKVIQSVMGHRNIKTTMDVYAEATADKTQESMKSLSEVFRNF